MDEPTLDNLRKKYFVEVWQPQAYVNQSWRGCALDRDQYNNTRMPQFLFEAIVTASKAEHFSIATDMGSAPHATIPADWGSFERHMLDPAHYAIDYVIYDASGRWACLADFDVTTFGADCLLAEKIDLILSAIGTSLRDLTLEAFGDLVDDPHVRSVIGSEV